MPKLGFLSYVGKSLSKDRAREMFRRMEIGEQETKLLLERYCSGYNNKTQEQCDFIPVDQQKTLLPDLTRRIRGWVQKNLDYFSLEEIEGMARYGLKKEESEGI